MSLPARIPLAAACLAVALAAGTATAQGAAEPPPEPPPSAAEEPPPAPAQPPAAPQVLAPPPAVASPRAPVAGSLQQGGGQRRAQSNMHGLGFAGGFTTGSGFSYRRYFGETALQITGIAIVQDRGDDALAFGGISAIRYLMIWHQPHGRSILPSVTALRFVTGATIFHTRDQRIETDILNCDTLPCTTRERDVVTEQTLIGVGTGIGFEFGAIMQPGFSVNLDLLLTAGFDEKGLSFVLPLPTAGLMYSW